MYNLFLLEYDLKDNTSICLSHCLPVGVIICNTNTLDRETKSHYMVVVQAQDMGGIATGSTATTSVKITILDANDNFASFTQSKEQSVMHHFSND